MRMKVPCIHCAQWFESWLDSMCFSEKDPNRHLCEVEFCHVWKWIRINKRVHMHLYSHITEHNPLSGLVYIKRQFFSDLKGNRLKIGNSYRRIRLKFYAIASCFIRTFRPYIDGWTFQFHRLTCLTLFVMSFGFFSSEIFFMLKF